MDTMVQNESGTEPVLRFPHCFSRRFSLRLFAVAVLFVTGLADRGLAQLPSATNTPIFKALKLFDLKKDGAYVFTFCSISRDLFVSFDEDTSQTVYRWNVDTGRQMDSYKFPKKYRCDNAVVSPDGRTLVLVAYDMLHGALQKTDKVRIMDLESGKVRKELLYDKTPARVQFSRDGKFILTHEWTRDPGGELVYDLTGNEKENVDFKVFDSLDPQLVWNISNSKGGPRPGLFYRGLEGKPQRLYPDSKAYWSDVTDIAVSADNRYVACSTFKGKLMIWRLVDAKLVFESQVGKQSFHIAFDPKTKRFLFADGDLDKMTWLQAIELSPEGSDRN